MMAATSFRSLILILYFSSLRLGTCSYSSLFRFTNCNYCFYDSWTSIGQYNYDFEKLFILSRPAVASARVISTTGFCRMRVPLFKWTKHGYVHSY